MPTDDELIRDFIARKGITKLAKTDRTDIDWRHQIKRHHTEGAPVTRSPQVDLSSAVEDHAGNVWYTNVAGEVTHRS